MKKTTSAYVVRTGMALALGLSAAGHATPVPPFPPLMLFNMQTGYILQDPALPPGSLATLYLTSSKSLFGWVQLRDVDRTNSCLSLYNRSTAEPGVSFTSCTAAFAEPTLRFIALDSGAFAIKSTSAFSGCLEVRDGRAQIGADCTSMVTVPRSMQWALVPPHFPDPRQPAFDSADPPVSLYNMSLGKRLIKSERVPQDTGQFLIEYQPDSTIKLRYVASQQCLVASTQTPAPPVLASCDDNPRALFTLIPASNGAVQLRNASTGLCAMAGGALYVMGQCANQDGQIIRPQALWALLTATFPPIVTDDIVRMPRAAGHAEASADARIINQ
ncbi:hypothetical protein [Bordetella trematum]|uniref:hypothetical protein n=1 Tax=Bordetella trematum TaxID=123899 RepID=UPI003988D887